MEIKINLKVGKRSSNNPFLLEMITIKVHPKIHSFLKQCCSVYENKVLELYQSSFAWKVFMKVPCFHKLKTLFENRMDFNLYPIFRLGHWRSNGQSRRYWRRLAKSCSKSHRRSQQSNHSHHFCLIWKTIWRIKGQIFWEGHQNLTKSPNLFCHY